MTEIAGFLLDNAAAVAGRVLLGTVLAGLVGAVIVVGAIMGSRKGKWLHVGAPFDPWPGRASFALWVIVAVPAFAMAGGVVGLGFAAENVVQQNRVTERIAHGALQGVLTKILEDAQAKQYVDGQSIKINDVAAFVERAPEALASFTHESAEAAVRAAGIESTLVKLSTRVAASIAAWLAKCEASDRLRLVTPVLADLKTRDVDNDGRVALSDVLDSTVRIHLEPRAAHFCREIVAGQAIAPGGIGAAALLVPLAACLVVRRRRKSAAARAPASPAVPPAP